MHLASALCKFHPKPLLTRFQSWAILRDCVWQ